ncbi:MAG: tRNA (cytidine/uridine-2'-O-)-methyltransferase TrmJ [Gammaproteobacteria bacterium]|nr:MAG: tRNA (cytidine/uridine-2'-O-)-methyltransferase TrmJ [Gammaproteobacteria bacterium]
MNATDPEPLRRVRIVLVETSHPGNIGAAARAMKTMGLRELVLVRPQDYPNAEATARASGADDLLARARCVDELDAALADCVYVVGTSARRRRLDWSPLGPEAAAQRLLAAAAHGPVALVFGREASGLDNAELARCHALVTLDTDPDYRALNLAAAVQVFCYELRRQWRGGVRPEAAAEPPATQAEFEGFMGHLEHALEHIGVLKADHPRQTLLRRLRRLFYRSRPSRVDINILRGILRAVEAAPPRRPAAPEDDQ